MSFPRAGIKSTVRGSSLMAVTPEELQTGVPCLMSSDYPQFRQHWCGQPDQPDQPSTLIAVDRL